MLLPAVTGFGLAEFVTLKSAWPAPATPIVTVAELLLGFVSCVAEATVAVSVMIVPAACLQSLSPHRECTGRTRRHTRVGATDGPVVVQVHPAGTGLSELNVVLTGNRFGERCRGAITRTAVGYDLHVSDRASRSNRTGTAAIRHRQITKRADVRNDGRGVVAQVRIVSRW